MRKIVLTLLLMLLPVSGHALEKSDVEKMMKTPVKSLEPSPVPGVLEVAEGISANPPLTVQGVKQVLNRMEAAQLDAALEHVALWNAAHLASEDLMEAMMAFSEKREPKFKGR